MSTKIEKSVISGSYEDLKKVLIDAGVNEKRFNGVMPNSIPQSGEFTDAEIVKMKITENADEVSSVVIKGKSNGKDFQCSLGFLNAMGTIKSKDEQFNENLIARSPRTDRFYVTGKSINNLPSDPALAIKMLIGKKFSNAKIVEIWQPLFKDGGYEDRDELIDKMSFRNVAQFTLS